MKRVYLDHNATTPVDPDVLAAMQPFFGDIFGNPSSLHWAGREARKALEEARDKAAQALSCETSEIIFTSGGSEANNLALQGVVEQIVFEKKIFPVSVVTTPIEHSSVRKTLDALVKKGLVHVTYVRVDEMGCVNPKDFEAAITEHTVLISCQWVNNEIGNILPIKAIGDLARARKIPFHVDAVQAVGKLPIDLRRLPVDLLSFSGHKIGGPKGVGGLFVKKGVKVSRILDGGPQEFEKRAGTENLPGIVGLGVAMKKVTEHLEVDVRRLTGLRDRLERELSEKISGTIIYGDPESRVGQTSKMFFEGVTSEAILLALDQEGIAVSSGSACASGAVEPSHVLLAMGVSEAQARGSIRFSLGRTTTEGDIDHVIQIVPKIVERFRA